MDVITGYEHEQDEELAQQEPIFEIKRVLTATDIWLQMGDAFDAASGGKRRALLAALAVLNDWGMLSNRGELFFSYLDESREAGGA